MYFGYKKEATKYEQLCFGVGFLLWCFGFFLLVFPQLLLHSVLHIQYIIGNFDFYKDRWSLLRSFPTSFLYFPSLLFPSVFCQPPVPKHVQTHHTMKTLFGLTAIIYLCICSLAWTDWFLTIRYVQISAAGMFYPVH